MSTPVINAANPPAESQISILDVLKWAAQFVGVVGGGSGGFAALSYGIGYLAIKHHDAMLGIPSTGVSHTAYVRTGASFFSTALQSMVSALSPWRFVWVLGVVAVLAMVVRSRSFLKADNGSARAKAIVVLCASGLVLAASAFLLPKHSSAFDQTNRDLLLTKDEPPDQNSEAFAVWRNLRSEDGELPLRIRFGWQCVSVAGLLYIAWLFHRLRKSFSDSSDDIAKGCWAVIDWVVRPAQLAIAIAMLALLPGNYGVLAISNHYPCVTLWLPRADAEAAGVALLAPAKPADEAKRPEKPTGKKAGARPDTRQSAAPPPPVLVRVPHGYLLSDLMAEPSEIVVLRKDPRAGHMTLHVYKRDSIKRLDVTDCGQRSILSL